jgi:sulfate transport system ATP-binding protein
LPVDASNAGSGDIIEVQIPSQLYQSLELKLNEVLILTPRKARVFVA